MRTIHLDGQTISTTDLCDVAYGRARAEIALDAMPKIAAARHVVENILDKDLTVYGVNTGFGSLVNTRISKDDLAELQLNLIRSHACGLGQPLSIPHVRAMMLARANSLAKGHSGVRFEVIEQLIAFLDHDITPLVPRIGSLGASGDLAQLAHMALSLIGEGQSYGTNGQLKPTKELLLEMGLIPLKLEAKEGLSLINGTSLMVGLMADAEHQLARLLPMADLILAVSIEARSCSIKPADERVHSVRPHVGQGLVAQRIRLFMEGSDNLQMHSDCNLVQDAYSFRCAPQVHGAVLESHNRLQEVVTIDLNSATDNPLIFPNPKNRGADEVISQGNFHGEILALAGDAMSLACFELASISERRIDQILDHARSGLPPFLAGNPGFESGMMIVQYAAAAAIAEMRVYANPATAINIPTSANQEDHVSMGATVAWSLIQAVERLADVLACELIVAGEALEHLTSTPSKWVAALHRNLRGVVQPLSGDRSLSGEMHQVAKILASGSWLSLVESELGTIPRL